MEQLSRKWTDDRCELESGCRLEAITVAIFSTVTHLFHRGVMNGSIIGNK